VGVRAGLLFLLPLWLFAQVLSVYAVPKMHCPLCTSAVKKSLTTLHGVQKAEVRLNTKEARVWHDESLDDAALKAAIGTTGYQGVLISRAKVPF
jgi:mercuric ion binding protein